MCSISPPNLNNNLNCPKPNIYPTKVLSPIRIRTQTQELVKDLTFTHVNSSWGEKNLDLTAKLGYINQKIKDQLHSTMFRYSSAF